MGHGNHQHGHCIGRQSLVPETFFQLSCTSSNWQTNGVYGPYAGTRPSTPVEKRIQQ
jgi:hypothetical protein